jgi:hypothetical protein
MQESPPNPLVFLPADEFGVERVFPIRNLVSDDVDFSDASPGGSTNVPDAAASVTTNPSSLESEGGSEQANGNTNYVPPYIENSSPQEPSNETKRPLSIRTTSTSPSFLYKNDDGVVRNIMERPQMTAVIAGVMGDAPGVTIYGASSSEDKYYACEDEPIHTPGAIQQYGALVALRYDVSGNLIVRFASENVFSLLKRSPEQLFRLASFLEILEENVQEELVTHIANALQSVNDEFTQLDVFTISMPTSTEEDQINLWCAMHVAQGTKDLIICEFERSSDMFYLDGLHDNKLLPKIPLHNLDNEVTPEEKLKSNTSGSIPLRVLQIARRRDKQAVSSFDLFNAMTQAQQQLANCTTIQSVLDTAVGLISELTGFHRVMFYRFDNKMNGCVDAELVDPQASSDIFRG